MSIMVMVAWRCDLCGHVWLARGPRPPELCAKCRGRRWQAREWDGKVELGPQEGPKVADVEGGVLKVVMVKGVGMAVAKAGPSPQAKPEGYGPESDAHRAMDEENARRICLGDDLADAVLRGKSWLAKKLAGELRGLLEAEAEESGWGPLDTIAVSDAEDLPLAWKHVLGKAGRRERREKIAAFLASLGPGDRRDIKDASSRLTE